MVEQTEYDLTFTRFTWKWLKWGVKTFILLVVLLFGVLLFSTIVQGTGESYNSVLIDSYILGDTQVGSTGGCFTVNGSDIYLLNTTRYTSTTPNTVRLADLIGGSDISYNTGANITTNLSGDTFFFSPPIFLSNGTTKCITFYSGGSGYTRKYKSISMPYTVDNLIILSGLYDAYADYTNLQTIYSIGYMNATESYINFISQSPVDISDLNAVGGVNVTYNFTDPNLNTTTPFLNWSVINSSLGVVYSKLNGSILQVENTQMYSNLSGVNYRFFFDDRIYPAIYSLDHDLMSNTIHNNITLANDNRLLLFKLYNVTSVASEILEVDIRSSTPTAYAGVYYCNSSYTSGNPSVTSGCVIIEYVNFTSCNHYHNQSCHNVISMPIVNNQLNGLTLTEDINIVIKGSNNGTINIGSIPVTTRIDTTQLSINNGVTWTNQASTVDAHIHFYSNNYSFKYTPYYYNTSGTLFEGTSRYDLFNLTPEPPTSVTITLNNTNLNYLENLLVTRTNSTPYNIATIQAYTYKLFNLQNNAETTLSTTNDSSYTLLISNMSSGIYSIIIDVVDSFGLTSRSYSENFYVTNNITESCNESITLNDTGVYVTFNWTTDEQINNTELWGVLNIVYRELFATTTGTLIFTNTTPTGNYSLYLNNTNVDGTSYYFDTGCTLNVCKNTWVRQSLPCSSNLRLINYTDTSNCVDKYYPSDTGTYEDCSLPPNTDKDLWIIILLFVFFIVLMILQMREPIVTIGTLIVGIVLSILVAGYFDTTNIFVYIIFPVIALLIGLLSMTYNS